MPPGKYASCANILKYYLRHGLAMPGLLLITEVFLRWNFCLIIIKDALKDDNVIYIIYFDIRWCVI